MKIAIARTAGFCMGVRRAVEKALDATNKSKDPIFTYGPLIHNPQVLQLLAEKDVTVLDRIPELGNGTVLIRAHGVPPSCKTRLKAAGFKVIDATCPRVIKVQSIIRTYTQKGYAAIIVGDKDHPEVTGLLGYAQDQGYVIDTLKDLDALPGFENAIIVAQTTQNTRLFDAVRHWAETKFPHYQVFHTICDSTERRQAEVTHLAHQVDAVLVVGGKNSGNTQRLAAIAAETGKPTYHIESEAELSPEALGGFQRIGITAGASTPNWVIKKVYRALEGASYKRARGLRRYLFHVQRTLLLNNLYVALGAGALCYACTRLQGIRNFGPHIFISFVYVLSMHILNHLIGQKADTYNDPDRARFYQQKKLQLSLLATGAGAAGLATAFFLGPLPFSILLVISLLGLSYNLPFLPERFGFMKYRRIRDIPGSKTVLIALAWGVVTSALPQLSLEAGFSIKAMFVFLWSTGMVFWRTAFFDILDMQGDRIVGKETIPILIGEKAALNHLRIAIAVIAALLLGGSLLRFVPGLGFALLCCSLFSALVLWIYQKKGLQPGIQLEFLVETNFLLAGFITFVWSLLIPPLSV